VNDKIQLQLLIKSNTKQAKESFEEIYIRYYQEILYIAQKYNYEESEDMTQTTFMQIWKARKSLTNINLKGLLITTLTNISKDMNKKHKPIYTSQIVEDDIIRYKKWRK